MATSSANQLSDFIVELEEFYRFVAPSKIVHAQTIAQNFCHQRESLKLYLETAYKVPGMFASLYLNARSRLFNPQAALYEDNVSPPQPTATPLDFTAKFVHLVRVCVEIVRVHRFDRFIQLLKPQRSHS